MRIGDVILNCKNISKSFSKVEVLKNINIEIKKGEVHAIIGANGAGKSTLMKIICGVHEANSGELIYKGKIEKFKTPLEAQEKGISIIYQELSLVSTLKNYENLFVGNEIKKYGIFTDDTEMIRRFRELCKRLNFDIDPMEMTRNMSISKQQMIEILKVVANDSDIIIMDEPTTSLSEKEKKSLFDIIRKLKEAGKTVIYISHMLEEVFSVCDRISILRDGEFIATKNVLELTKDKVVELMTGKAVKRGSIREKRDNKNETVLEVKGLEYKNILKDVSFQVKRGETVGIIGTNGSGKSTILKIITGVLNPTQGEVQVNGRISALLELGAGFNMEYSGLENVYLNGTMIGFTREEIDKKLDDILAFADIGDFIHQPVKTYSSGMFVRLAFAVAINIEPEILIVDEALSVGDVFFQAKCYKKFEDFKKMGKTILFVSHDLGSISKYCDRVVLLDKGVKRQEGNPKEIVNLYKKVLVGLDDSEEEKPEKDRKKAVKRKEPGWNRTFETNPNVLEYGNGKASITDFILADETGTVSNTIEKGSEIKMKVRFHETVQEPIFAYSIKNLQGTEITGTNTLFEKSDISSKKEGQVCEITFSQEMNLQGGEYLLSLGCTGYVNGEFEVFHRLYDVCGITVVSTKNTVGFYDMNSRVSVK